MLSWMSAASDVRMTVDDNVAWAPAHPGRYELIDGIVHAMSPERLIHAKIKAAVYVALLAQIRQRALPCHALPDA